MNREEMLRKIAEISKQLDETQDDAERRDLMEEFEELRQELRDRGINVRTRLRSTRPRMSGTKKPPLFSHLMRSRGGGGPSGRVRPQQLTHKDTSVRQFEKRAEPKRDLNREFAGITRVSVWTEPGLDESGQPREKREYRRDLHPENLQTSEAGLAESVAEIKGQPQPRDLLYAYFLELNRESDWIHDPEMANAAYNEFIDSRSGEDIHQLLGYARAMFGLSDDPHPAEYASAIPPEVLRPALDPVTGVPLLGDAAGQPNVQPSQWALETQPLQQPIAEPLMPLAPLAEPMIQTIPEPLQPPLTGPEAPINDSPI